MLSSPSADIMKLMVSAHKHTEKMLHIYLDYSRDKHMTGMLNNSGVGLDIIYCMSYQIPLSHDHVLV